MVIVVEFFAPDQDTYGKKIGAGIFDRMVAVAPVMSEAVYDAGRPERYPHHLYAVNETARNQAENRNIDAAQYDDAGHGETRVKVSLDPVVGRAVAVFFNGVRIAGFGEIQQYAAPEYAAQPAKLRAVRVFRRFRLRMMFSMDGHPLPGDHACGQPDPETEEMTGCRMEIERVMRLMPVQVYRDRDDREMGEAQCDQQVLTPMEAKHFNAADGRLRPSPRGSNAAANLCA